MYCEYDHTLVLLQLNPKRRESGRSRRPIWIQWLCPSCTEMYEDVNVSKDNIIKYPNLGFQQVFVGSSTISACSKLFRAQEVEDDVLLKGRKRDELGEQDLWPPPVRWDSWWTFFR